MTDDRLRDAARHAMRDDVHAHARYLIERVRAGELSKERLRLAAYLGVDAAALAAPGVAPPPDELEAWARELGTHGREAIVRALVAIAHMFPAPSSHASDPALRAAEAWCVAPGPDTAEAALAASVADSYAQTGAPYLGGLPEPDTLAWWCPNHAALIAGTGEAQAPEGGAARAAEWLAQAAVAAATRGGAGSVRMTITERLLTWVLARRTCGGDAEN